MKFNFDAAMTAIRKTAIFKPWTFFTTNLGLNNMARIVSNEYAGIHDLWANGELIGSYSRARDARRGARRRGLEVA